MHSASEKWETTELKLEKLIL